MALIRPPLKCTSCGHENGFKHHPLTPQQKIFGWCGDNGGEYPDVCENCGKGIYEGLLSDIIPPEDFEMQFDENGKIIFNNKKQKS